VARNKTRTASLYGAVNAVNAHGVRQQRRQTREKKVSVKKGDEWSSLSEENCKRTRNERWRRSLERGASVEKRGERAWQETRAIERGGMQRNERANPESLACSSAPQSQDQRRVGRRRRPHKHEPARTVLAHPARGRERTAGGGETKRAKKRRA